MVGLGDSMKPTVMLSYPHMLSADAEVWSNYLTKPAIPIDRLWYDVHIGKAVTPVNHDDILLAKVAAGITRKRIDVVMQCGRDFLVTEVKPFGGYLAFGQALNYSRLFAEEYAVTGRIYGAVVCHVLDLDVKVDYERFGVVGIIT